jgi:translation initiation factor 3 subunit M
MRLLSLATLGSANQEITYALIAKTLQIDESEVESWIITAISDGVVEAKLDQLKRIVTVRYLF